MLGLSSIASAAWLLECSNDSNSRLSLSDSSITGAALFQIESADFVLTAREHPEISIETMSEGQTYVSIHQGMRWYRLGYGFVKFILPANFIGQEFDLEVTVEEGQFRNGRDRLVTYHNKLLMSCTATEAQF
jgi:hypothetical protein